MDLRPSPVPATQRTHRRGGREAAVRVLAHAVHPSSSQLQGHGTPAQAVQHPQQHLKQHHHNTQQHLYKLVKEHRKHLEKKQCQDNGQAYSLGPLLEELRQLERMRQFAAGAPSQPSTTTASTTALSPRAPTSPVHPQEVRLSRGAVVPVPLWDEEPSELLDISAPQYAPRDYEVPGRILVCQGSKCQKLGALGVLQAVSAVTAGSDAVQVLPCKCLGKCKEGPALRVKPEAAPGALPSKGALYTRLTPDQVPAILDAHFLEPQQPATPSPLAEGV